MLLLRVRWAALLILSLLRFPTAAVTLEPIPVSTLATQADVILQGTVLGKTCLRDQSGRIYTRVEIKVAEVWKGSLPGNPFIIVHSGGVLGEKQSTVSAQVQYNVGEEVVAFVVRNLRGDGVTLGLAQGKFHVWKEAISGTQYVTNPFFGVPERPDTAVARSNSSASNSTSDRGLLTLGNLKNRVREAVR